MKTSEVLKAARALIEKPENWTTGAYARDMHGTDTDPQEDSATCFCALGAINHVLGGASDFSDAASALDSVIHQEHGDDEFSDIAEYNDAEATSHADVLAVFDTAITEAEKEESENG